ncbi:hypothetical protein, partial [Enterobacter cloacae complex sp. 4DZ3-17B2]|uniref:hypothetical protein n=1 Tax=Enterobacter cloacae complex sp. 4DZ3-17B2 TaxID=2511990 RepID=UPI0013EBA7D2
VGGSVNKFPGQKWQPNVGVQATFRWKREPQPQNGGSVTITHDKQGGQPGVTNVGVQQTFGNNKGHVTIGAGATKVGGQKWQTNVGVQGQHSIFENKHGQISVGGSVNKFPGQKWQPNVGV